MGVTKNLKFFANGTETIEYLTNLIDTLDMEKFKGKRVIQPVSLLLLDINMQGLSGIEVNK